MGKKSEAIRYAEASRGSWTSDSAVDRLCEEIVLSSGLADEAYRRYGLRAHRAGGRAVSKLRRAILDVIHRALEPAGVDFIGDWLLKNM